MSFVTTFLLPAVFMVGSAYLTGYVIGREVGREQGRVDAYRRVAAARRRARL